MATPILDALSEHPLAKQYIAAYDRLGSAQLIAPDDHFSQFKFTPGSNFITKLLAEMLRGQSTALDEALENELKTAHVTSLLGGQ